MMPLRRAAATPVDQRLERGGALRLIVAYSHAPWKGLRLGLAKFLSGSCWIVRAWFQIRLQQGDSQTLELRAQFLWEQP